MCRLLSSTLFLFPTLLHSNSEAAASIVKNINWMSEFMGPTYGVASLEKSWVALENEVDNAEDYGGVAALAQWWALKPEQRPSGLYRAEFADALAELAEAICLSEGKSVW